MPTMTIFGHPCRVRPLLNAIGAQEALEALVPVADARMRGPSAVRLAEHDRLALARRRNNAEAMLRPGERMAWGLWRSAAPDIRAAVYAVLTDRPTAEEVGSAMAAIKAVPDADMRARIGAPPATPGPRGPTIRELAYLKMFKPDTYGINIPWTLGKDMKAAGWVEWLPPKFGTALYGITEAGKVARDGTTAEPGVDELDMSVRAHNGLHNENIITLSQLCNMTEQELFRIPNLGRRSVAEIVEALAKRNLVLASNDDGHG